MMRMELIQINFRVIIASLENQSENHTPSTTPATIPPTIEEETPGRNCSQSEECSPNEQCRKKDDNSSFCYCLPRFRRNGSTQECELNLIRLDSSLKSTCVKTIDILKNNQNLGLDTSGKST
ncbi:hypothetical protein PV325_000382 [Microctonus aethiopoides]|nr:hypothetical protein PV325_000382 [Microctonus aethiopoides]